MDNPIVTWSVGLEGHPFDLQDCAVFFTHSSEIRICEELQQDGSTKYYLRSSLFDNVQSHKEIKAIAEPLITKMNGSKILYFGGDPVRFSGIRSHHANGGIGAVASIGGVEARTRVSAISKSENQEPNIAEKSLVFSLEDDLVADALEYFGRADNWFDLYKVYETIAIKQNKLSKMGWIDPEMENNFTGTANLYRHSKHYIKGQPKKILSFEEAKSVIGEALKQWLEYRTKAHS